MIKTKKNVIKITLSAEDVEAMNQTTDILLTMAEAIEDRDTDLTEVEEAVLAELTDAADIIERVLQSLKNNEWTISEENDDFS